MEQSLTELETLFGNDSAEFMLSKLARSCDGANQRDSVGFSKIDYNFGHSLVNQAIRGPHWTAKQSAAAIKLIKKYQNQLGGKEFIDNWLMSPKFANVTKMVELSPINPRKLFSRDKTAIFKFNYDIDVIKSIKNIQGVYNNTKYYASWDQDEHVWKLPVNPSSILLIMEVAEKFKFDIEQRFIDYFSKIKEKINEDKTMLILNDNRNIILSGDCISIYISDPAIHQEFKNALTFD